MKLIHREVAEHGTYGGYQTHEKLGEDPCDPCRVARNRYMQDYRRRKGHTKTTLVPYNLAECPNCGHHLAGAVA